MAKVLAPFCHSITNILGFKMPKIVVSTCPYSINCHLVPLDFKSGLSVNGIITSVEEKGKDYEILLTDLVYFIN